jgi:hypothetical protein
VVAALPRDLHSENSAAAREGTMGQNFREAVRQFDENFAPRLM